MIVEKNASTVSLAILLEVEYFFFITVIMFFLVILDIG